MAEIERNLADCVGAIYEAATSGGSWLEVGDRVGRLLNAPRTMLRLGRGEDGLGNVLMKPDGSEPSYAAHFIRVDPYVARARRDFAALRGENLGSARVSAELVPEESFLRSEYYNDFARLHGRRHMIGGMLGVADATPIAAYRGEGAAPFAELEVRLLETLLPHMQRALELRLRLAREEHVSSLTRAVLDALPAGVGVVDAGLKIHFLNDAGRHYLAEPSAALRSQRSGPYAASGVYLSAASREDAATLRALVTSAASGGVGGSMRATARDGTSIAVLVSPTPRQLAEELAGPGGKGAGLSEALALLILRPLHRQVVPPASTLAGLFGFSRAEAEVATALSGGANAEAVAQRRGVSLMTVRSQIRTILAKSGSENLRDFERSMAILAAIAPRAGEPP